MNRFVALVPLLLAVLVASTLRAATVNWTTSTVAGPTDVSTAGTLVGAMNVGSATPQTVNGVTFAADPTGAGTLALGSGTVAFGNLASTFNNFWTAANPGGDAAYLAALDTARWGTSGSGTVTLGGLTVGRKYLVQLWIADTRAGFDTRVRTVDGVATTSGGPNIATGAFIADATTQVITVDDGANTFGPQVNLIQLRDVSLVVTTAADEFNTPSGANLSLREALRDAAAAGGADAIVFAPGLSGQTITLGSEIVVNGTGGVTVDATALTGGLTVNGGAGGNRLFSISSGPVTLAGLNLTGGDGGGATLNGRGGAILNQGTLTLTRCTLSGNSTAEASGGAIANTATLTLRQCTVSGNNAGSWGGGLYNDGTAHLLHCTVANNHAGDRGGGIYNDNPRSLTLENSLVAGNSAGFLADIFNAGTLTSVGANLVQTTVGGTITGTLTIANPLLAALAANNGPTPTHATSPASPARNAAVGSAITADQRGYPLFGAADIGAYEGQLGPIPAITVNEDTETTGALPFRVGTVGTLGATSGNTALVPNANLTLRDSGGSRTLTATPAANANGTAILTVRDTVSGETTACVLTVTPLADTPSVTGATTLEDTQTTTGLVLSRNAADGAEVTHFKITAITSGNLFKNDGATAITAGSFITFAEGNAGLKFTPAANFNGNASFTFRASTSGVDAGLGGGEVTASITVTAVNDAPGFTKGADQSIQMNFGPSSVSGWATGITDGDAEVTQTLTFLVTNDNPALFTTQPAISANGTLTYTPAPFQTGTATVTVRLQDNGSTAHGGVDTSPAQTFTLTVSDTSTTLLVTNTSGSYEDPGSLPYVILHALDESGSRRITFDPSLDGQTITLGSGIIFGTGIYISDRDTADVLLIDASNLPTGLTLHGGTGQRIFSVEPGARAALRGLTLTGGNPSHGGEGGAIQNLGTLTVTHCALSGNSALGGGAIYNNGTLALTHCTLSENTASGLLGGGAIYNNGTLTLTHCTLSGNSANVGGGGAIRNHGTLTLANSLIAGNTATASSGPDIRFISGTLTRSGVNLIGNNDTVTSQFPAAASPGLPNARGDYVGTRTAPLDPRLAALANNGGPTRTMRLLPTSPALNRITTPLYPADQRGYPIVGAADIGAYEFGGLGLAALAPVTLEEDTTTQVTVAHVDGLTLSGFTLTGAADNPSLLPSGSISISGSGDTRTVTLTPAADQSGTATVTLTLTDGTTLAVSSVLVTVTDVNDVPRFTKGADQSIGPGTTAAQSVPGWATGISDGDGGGQALTFTVTETGSSGLFTAPPAVAADGTLTFTPNGTVGTATFSVTLTDDATRGGPALTSAPQTFTVSVAMDYTVTTSGGVLTVTETTGGDNTLTLTQPAEGFLQFDAPGRSFSVNGGPALTGSSGSVALAGITEVVVNAGAGNDTINVGATSGNHFTAFPSLTLNGGTGDDTVNFNRDVTFVAGVNLDVDLQNDAPAPGVDQVTVGFFRQLFLSGPGTATVKVSRSIMVENAARLETADGALLLEANRQAVPTAADFMGIVVRSSAAVRSTGTGSVTLRGTGGAGTGSSNHGIECFGTVTSAGGEVVVTGLGGGLGDFQLGIQLHAGSMIKSGGDLTLAGRGGGSAGSNLGIGLKSSGGSFSAGGNGTLILHGTGGEGTSAFGLELQGGTFTSAGGAVEITGIGGGGERGIKLDGGSLTTSANGGTLTLVSDSMLLSGGTLSTRLTDSVTLRPLTAGRLIDLGSFWDDTANTLGLSDDELDRITTGTLVIGDATSGPITISAALSPANYKVLALGQNTIFAAAGQFNADIGPTAADYERLTVAGTVTLDPAAQLNLTATGGYVPQAGDAFTLLANDGNDAINGTFTGKPEGFTAANFLGSGAEGLFSYLGGTGNDLVVTVPNTAPLAGADSLERAPRRALRIPVATLLANDSSPLGLPLSIVAVPATSTGGVPLLLAGGVVFYQAPGSLAAPDTFTYTVGDGTRTATGTVTVTVRPESEAPTQNILATALVGDAMQVTAAGIPGRSYLLQRAPSLASPVTWSDLGAPVAADALGQLVLTDPVPVSPGFYRVIETAAP